MHVSIEEKGLSHCASFYRLPAEPCELRILHV